MSTPLMLKKVVKLNFLSHRKTANHACRHLTIANNFSVVRKYQNKLSRLTNYLFLVVATQLFHATNTKNDWFKMRNPALFRKDLRKKRKGTNRGDNLYAKFIGVVETCGLGINMKKQEELAALMEGNLKMRIINDTLLNFDEIRTLTEVLEHKNVEYDSEGWQKPKYC